MMRHAGPGQFEPMKAKCDFGRREDDGIALGNQLMDGCDRFPEAFMGSFYVRTLNQACCDVTPVRTVDFHDFVVALIKLEQSPLGGVAVQV